MSRKLSLVAALSALIVVGTLDWGCGSKAGETQNSAAPSNVATSAEDKAAMGPDGKLVANRNGEGRLLCPVMGNVIKSEKDAVGYQDYKGVRYYFCCGMCPPKFKADPTKYAKK
jgi:YHS domain-containing protein